MKFFSTLSLFFILMTPQARAQLDLPPITVVGPAIDPFSFSVDWLSWNEMMLLFQIAASGAPEDEVYTPVEGVQIQAAFGCGSDSSVAQRTDKATLVFSAQYRIMQTQAMNPFSSSGRAARRWLDRHRNGDRYEMTWPNGTTGIYEIGIPSVSVPLVAEVSCNP